MVSHISNSPADTNNLALDLALNIKPGAVIALSGPLGSGKTAFTKALAKGLGVNQRITSPTFTISKIYPLPSSQGDLIHIDLYRLSSQEDLRSIDPRELFDQKANITVIEWPEIIASLLPTDTISITFKIISNQQRQITINHS